MPFGRNSSRQRFGESQGSVLGGIVGGGSGKDARGSDREVVDDRASLPHQGQYLMGHQESSGQVGVDDSLPGIVGKLRDGQGRVPDTGVVDQDVDAVKLFPDAGGQSLNRPGIANVADLREHPDTTARQFPAGFLERSQCAAREDQVASFPG